MVSLKRVVIKRREGKAVKSRGLFTCMAMTSMSKPTEKLRDKARSIKILGRGNIIRVKRRMIPKTAETL